MVGGIKATGNIGSVGYSIDGDIDASSKELLPVPNIGFYGHYLFKDKWLLEGRLDWFGITYGEWGGTLFSTDIRLAYLFINGISIGTGLHFFDVDVNYKARFWKGNLKYQFFGPRVDIAYRF